MKRLRYLGTLIVLLLLVLVVGLLATLAFKADQKPAAALVDTSPQPVAETPPSISPSRRSAKIDLRRASAPSTTALHEIDTGKFIVRTEFINDTEKGELYRQLCLRGGLYVVQDVRDRYWWLRSPSERVPLAESNLPLDTYALNRPRLLSPLEARFTGGFAVQSGEQLFLVMPKNFEARVLTEIEQVMPEPLSAYASASLTLELTPGGYLEFVLTKVDHRQRGAVAVNHPFRGL